MCHQEQTKVSFPPLPFLTIIPSDQCSTYALHTLIQQERLKGDEVKSVSPSVAFLHFLLRVLRKLSMSDLA